MYWLSLIISILSQGSIASSAVAHAFVALHSLAIHAKTGWISVARLFLMTFSSTCRLLVLLVVIYYLTIIMLYVLFMICFLLTKSLAKLAQPRHTLT